MVTTATIVTMFLNALLYDLAFPDKTPCARYTTKASCLSEPSPYYAGKTNCLWDSHAQQCRFNQPSSDFFTIIIISVATSIFSVPILLFTATVFHRLLIPATRQPLRSPEEAVTPTADGRPSARRLARVKVWDIAERRKRRLARLEALTQAAVSEVKDATIKRHQELVDFIASLKAKIERDTADAPTFAQTSKLGGFLRSYETRDDVKKLAELEGFLVVFRRRWRLGDNGQPLPDTWLQRCTRSTSDDTLRSSIKDEIITAFAFERELKRLKTNEARQKRLLEYARVDFLSPSERKIYLRNKIDFTDEEEHGDVHAWAKFVGWALLLLFDLGLGFYVCLFGIQKGASTTNAWLAAFLYSAGQDILVSAPLIVLWYHIYMPAHIKHRIRAEVDGASQDPFVFSTYVPPGPAARVIRWHPTWASRLAKAGRPPADMTLSPLANERAIADDFAERYRRHFRQTQQVSHSLVFYVSMAVVTAFIALPEPAQDMVLDQSVPVAVGAAAYGMHLLYNIQTYLLSLPLGALAALLLLATLLACVIRRARALYRSKKSGPKVVFTPMSLGGGTPRARPEDTPANSALRADRPPLQTVFGMSWEEEDEGSDGGVITATGRSSAFGDTSEISRADSRELRDTSEVIRAETDVDADSEATGRMRRRRTRRADRHRFRTSQQQPDQGLPQAVIDGVLGTLTWVGGLVGIGPPPEQQVRVEEETARTRRRKKTKRRRKTMNIEMDTDRGRVTE